MRVWRLATWVMVVCLAAAPSALAQKGPDKGVKDATAPWHVPQAEVRFPVVIDPGWKAPAGFLKSSPRVARATLYLPGHDPTQMVPIVYSDDGRQVGAVTLWAAPGEPLAAL